MTWEDLPATLRERLEPRIGQTPTQSVVLVPETVAPDAAPRRVDHGDVIFSQAITPGAGMRLIADPPRKQYGAAGTELWPVRTPEGDVFCGRGPAPKSNLLVAVPANAVGPTYCWRDADKDGRFDALFENNGVRDRPGMPGSAFLVRSIGRDERLKAPVPYAPIGGPPAIRQVIALRYVGAVDGRVAADGRVTEGVVALELLTGRDLEQAEVMSDVLVPLDADGRGRLTHRSGFVVEVDRADVDGTASLKLVSALSQGEVLLSPPLTRDDVLDLLRDMLAGGG